MDPNMLAIMDNWTQELSSFQTHDPRSRIASLMAANNVPNAVYGENKTPNGIVKTITNPTDPTNGFSILLYPDGSLYFGNITNGLRNGFGTRTYANSPMVYIGQYSGNKKNGSGKMVNARTNTVVYDGEWRQDMKEGQGRLLYDQGTYLGGFVGDLFHGRGKLSWRNGDVYDGDFVRGDRTGRGILKFANGDVYDGEFVNGVSHGMGSYLWPNGELYVGEFRQGQLMGKGMIKYDNGIKGEGMFGPTGKQVVYNLMSQHK